MFSSCSFLAEDDNSGQKEPTLTIKNESSYDLSDVTWSDKTFASSGSDLLKTASAKKEVTDGDTGYVVFTRKDSGISCRTEEIAVIPRDGSFVFTDDTMVVEVANTSNIKQLSVIDFTSKLTIETSGRAVIKNDVLNAGESVVNNKKQIDGQR
jgi:hypothetical protein